jgi:hypothetical protein
MSERIVLEREEIAGLIHEAHLLELRVDTPVDVREQWLGTATTAMDALCGLCEREGTDAVWDVLEMLSHRELMAFASVMTWKLSETSFSADG